MILLKFAENNAFTNTTEKKSFQISLNNIFNSWKKMVWEDKAFCYLFYCVFYVKFCELARIEPLFKQRAEINSV